MKKIKKKKVKKGESEQSSSIRKMMMDTQSGQPKNKNNDIK